MASNQSSTDAAPVQKHRACDECRSRKLACTKEPEGCSRCRREGIDCHYSPQKPMGRPRKRRLVEDAAGDGNSQPVAAENVAVTSTGQVIDQKSDGSHQHYHVHDGSGTPMMGFPADSASLGFLDDSAAVNNLDFLDLLPYDYEDGTNIHVDPQILAPSHHHHHHHHGAGVNEQFPLSINGVDLLNGISFEEDPNSSAAHMSKELSDSLQQYWASQEMQQHTSDFTDPSSSSGSDLSNAATSPESIPGGQCSSSASPETSSFSHNPTPSRTLKAIPSVACGCLSNLYLSLDSLSRLPDDVFGAIRVARHATKVAHDVVRCPVCSQPLVDEPTKPPPIQCLQNLMCLAALVPSACNAYAAILELVDEEVSSAKAEGRTIWFSFMDIGGLRGIGSKHDANCPKLASFNNSHMEPDTWRTTMRAILRLDVYGFDAPPDGVESDDAFRSRGLKDVVRLLDERSAKRHERMDRLVATGDLPEQSDYLLQHSYKPVPPEERNCIRVLEAARIALEHLVIA